MFIVSSIVCGVFSGPYFVVQNVMSFLLLPGLSHPFWGIGPGPLELGKLAAFRLKLGKSILSICMKFPFLD